MIWLVALCLLVPLFGFVVVFGAPYVPSHDSEVRRAFRELYPLSASDTVVDFGAGDGRVLRIARQSGARAVGYELNPLLVGIARLLSLRDPDCSVHMADYWTVSLPSETTLVYVFGVSRDAARLTHTLQRHADLRGRPLLLMTYGAPLPDRQASKRHRAHHLYEFVPLHPGKAQV